MKAIIYRNLDKKPRKAEGVYHSKLLMAGLNFYFDH